MNLDLRRRIDDERTIGAKPVLEKRELPFRVIDVLRELLRVAFVASSRSSLPHLLIIRSVRRDC